MYIIPLYIYLDKDDQNKSLNLFNFIFYYKSINTKDKRMVILYAGAYFSLAYAGQRKQVFF